MNLIIGIMNQITVLEYNYTHVRLKAHFKQHRHTHARTCTIGMQKTTKSLHCLAGCPMPLLVNSYILNSI